MTRLSIKRYVAWLALAVLFGPFAITYLLGFFGEPMPGKWFGHWFMGALTVAGAIATVDFAQSIRWHGVKELGCVLPIAAATCWCGYIFVRDLGVLN